MEGILFLKSSSYDVISVILHGTEVWWNLKFKAMSKPDAPASSCRAGPSRQQVGLSGKMQQWWRSCSGQDCGCASLTAQTWIPSLPAPCHLWLLPCGLLGLQQRERFVAVEVSVRGKEARSCVVSVEKILLSRLLRLRFFGGLHC